MVGRIANIACIIISWSTNPAADPRSMAVVGTSDQNVDQALSNLGCTEPHQVTATFQTHQRLQHQKQYIQKLTRIIHNISDVLPDLAPPAKGQAMAPLKTVEKIVLDKAPKAISPLREPPSTKPTPAIDVCNSHHTSTDNSNNGAPSPTPDWQGPHRSWGKETTSRPLPPGYIEDPIIADVKLL
ncbi:hypothetical protein K439DRAFT_1191010 [Ramaria rubella]|nr:hypothetical protein K439DRAFT_1191010 [Ramaria rubella]